MTKIADELGSRSVRLFSRLLSLFDLETGLKIGRFLGRTAFYFSNRRRVAYADIKAALGPGLDEKARWKIVREQYEHLGQMFVEILSFHRLDLKNIDQFVQRHHWDRYDRAIHDGKGVILLAAHFGNWELMQIVSSLCGKPVHVLARTQKLTKLNEVLNRMRESHGSVYLSRGMGVRDLLRSLRRREPIALLGDQDAGKQGGLILPFFGRKTTVPTGAFELAMRTGATVLPCFMTYEEGARHHLTIGSPLGGHESGAPGREIETHTRRYLQILEEAIRLNPSQWLWGTKRWKYSWTKRLLILSDGKPGHVKQSEALAEQFQTVTTQYGRPGMEYPTNKIEVRFKSSFHRFLFSVFALFFHPWAQGRLRMLGFFFTPETQKGIMSASADFVISAGSSLSGLNLCLARDFRAKSIVLMKPGFPYNLLRYDLAVVPAHDRGILPGETFRTLLAPSPMDPEDLEEAARSMAARLRDPERVEIGIFLGGSTRGFEMKLSDIRKVFESLEKLPSGSGDFLVTTSRRTPDEISEYLKKTAARLPACQNLVVAKEDPSPDVASGMMALTEIHVVTEDSISMISEAIRSGKKVIVLSLTPGGVSPKHRRFKELLARERVVVLARPEELAEKILQLRAEPGPAFFESETLALKKKLQEIL